LNQGHQICFEDVVALAELPNCTTRGIWEAIEISLHENFSEEGGYQFSPAWKIIIHTIKQQRVCDKHTLPISPLPNQGTATTA
jgi:hypothetical protein